MNYLYYRWPKYTSLPSAPSSYKEVTYHDIATTFKEQVNLRTLLTNVKSGDIIRTRDPSTLLGTVGNKRYPATTLLIKLLTDLHSKGVIVDFTLTPALNDSRIWFELLNYQKAIGNEARAIGTRRKLLSGNITGRNRIEVDWNEVKGHFAKGHSLSRMAEHFKVSKSTVRNWRTRLVG
jgi:hypothetical protein